MRPVERLWSALEERPRLRGLRQDIKARLGWEYELAAPFLRPSGERATRYPCPFPSGPGCPRRILMDSDRSIRAICGCTPKECDAVMLFKDGDNILRFDDSAFARHLGRQFDVSGEHHFEADGDLIALGTIKLAAGKRLPVVLMMAGSCQQAEALTARVELKYRQGALLLTPTEHCIDPVTESRLMGAGFKWLVLAELLFADSSKLIATLKLVDVMRSGGKTHPASTPGEGTRRARRGFAPNAEDHRRVAAAVLKVDDWPSHLDKVCGQLQGVSAELPKKLRKEGFKSWDEVADEITGPANSSHRECVAAHIRYRLKWVGANQRGEKSLSKVSR